MLTNETIAALRTLDQWLRHRLRAIQLKQWRRGSTIFQQLRKLGVSVDQAAIVAGHAKRWWLTSAKSLNVALSVAYFDRLGVPRFS
jgi:RNA-directed DNA polymerase